MKKTSAIKILIAEHDPIDVELLHYELHNSGLLYTSQVVGNEFEYASALVDFMPDIILADYTFPTFDGPKAFALREQLAPDTPFIFVSGTIGEERSIELIKNGVTDYCLKGNLELLNHKVDRALKESATAQRKKQMENQLVLSKNRLARAQQVAKIGDWEFNLSNGSFRCSDEIFRTYGLIPHALRIDLRSFLHHVHSDDAALVIKFIRGAADRPADSSITFRILQSEGQLSHIYMESKVEFNKEGTIAAAYGIMQDVTRNVKLENVLADQRTSRIKEIAEAVLAAQENERAEIEKELHENVNQILGAAKLYIELGNYDSDIRETWLQKAAEYVVNAIDQIRIISKKIAIPNRRYVGLFELIRTLTADLSIAGGLTIHVDFGNMNEDIISEKLQLNIYRIIQEQLTNILKHASASAVAVILAKNKNEVVLLITDNGIGCDMSKKRNGVGIRNIMSRAELNHGTAEVNSSPGEGYHLKLRFHINADNCVPAYLN